MEPPLTLTQPVNVIPLYGVRHLLDGRPDWLKGFSDSRSLEKEAGEPQAGTEMVEISYPPINRKSKSSGPNAFALA